MMRSALRLARATRMPLADRQRLRDLMREVVRTPPGDEILPARLCKSLQATYRSATPSGRLSFLAILARQDVEEFDAVLSGCRSVLDANDQIASLRARTALREALKPTSERIFEAIAQQPDGLQFLVSLRADLLEVLSAAPSRTLTAAVAGTQPSETPEIVSLESSELDWWRSIDAQLRRVLTVWFDTGLLTLCQLTWDHTPASLLEKIMQHERVHTFTGWHDLRHRLSGPSRRMFAFTHPRFPGEPLVFVQVALLPRVPTALSDVLTGQQADTNGMTSGETSGTGGDGQGRDPPAAAVAAFYSISSPFDGLRGVPLGGLLIKQALGRLLAEQPGLHTFVTLSPVPGFRKWLERRMAQRGADAEVEEARSTPGDGQAGATAGPSSSEQMSAAEACMLDELRDALAAARLCASAPFDEPGPLHSHAEGSNGHGESCELARVQAALMALCARYLCRASHRRRPIDPVASFHLRNGSMLRALHWGANLTPRGLQESGGIMVNYEYTLGDIERLHSAFISSGQIAASQTVWQLAGPA